MAEALIPDVAEPPNCGGTKALRSTGQGNETADGWLHRFWRFFPSGAVCPWQRKMPTVQPLPR